MTIIRMFCSSVVVVITIAACVAGAPVQNQGENVGLNNAVYTQPELAEALARTYEAIEWERNNDQDEQTGENHSRNLDHIGGGNLLRNLDHIGGGNLLREITSSVNEPELNYELFGGEDSLREMNKEPYRQSRSAQSSVLELDSIGGGNFVRRDAPNEYERNLDHIGGSNLLRNVKVKGHRQGRLIPINDRNLDHIGGSNLLRDLEIEPYSETDSYRNRRAPVEGNDQSSNRRNQPKKQDYGAVRGTLDSIGGGNLVGLVSNEYDRNLDHIGGSNLLRDLEIEPYSETDSYRNRRAPVEDNDQSSNRRNQHKKHEYGATRGTLDSIGGGNFVRRDVDDTIYRERNLDHIGGIAGPRNLDHIDSAHRMRQTRRGLDSLSGATFGESKRFEQRRIQNNPFKQDINRELMMNRVPSEGSAKRNFDEIDRTNFDSFVKRNFDEIDRSGFDNFVKRNLMDAYLASRQR